MPIYKLETFKRLGTEEWLNRYWISATSLAAAIPQSNPIVNAERAFHSESVTFTYRRISDIGAPGGEFANDPLNLPGLVPGSTTAGLLPLWNVLKLYFNKGYSRPDYKLYRGCLGEANTEGGTVNSTFLATVVDTWDDIIAAATPYLVTLGGNPVLSVTGDSLIRERQLHRRKRRVTTGGFISPS